MDPATIKPWLDIIVSYGVPLVITILVIWLAIKYVPKFIDGSLEAQKEIPKAINNLANKLDDHMHLIKELDRNTAPVHALRKGLEYSLNAAISVVKSVNDGKKIESDVILDLRKGHAVIQQWRQEHERTNES